MFRAVRQIRPKAVICENVRGLLRPSFKRYFDYIQRELELPFEERADGASWEEHDEILKRRREEEPRDPSERYEVIMTPVNAADYGVPQIRHRVILVAFRADLNVDIEAFKRAVRPQYSEEALIRSMLDGSYWKRHRAIREVPDHVVERVHARLPKELPQELPQDEDGEKKPWRTLRDAIAGIDGNKPLPPVPEELFDRKEHYLGALPTTSAGPVPVSTTATHPTSWTDRRRRSRPACTVYPVGNRSCSWTTESRTPKPLTAGSTSTAT
ncbi:hypothetical protein GCM10020295_57390 [Streptomyces cinereospinus]